MTGKADVVILTYRPDPGLCDVIQKLNDQRIPPDKIILMNTEKEYMDELM